MSAARPNCRVCISAQVNWIDSKLREGTSDRMVAAGIEQRRQKHPTGVLALSRDQIRAHRLDCLGLARDNVRTGTTAGDDIELAGRTEQRSDDPAGEGDGADGPSYTLPDDVDVGVKGTRAPRPDLIPPLTVEELADPVKRANMIAQALYHPSKLNEMSAKELLALHQNEVRLAEAAAKMRETAEATGDDETTSDLDEAMAQAAGHRPDLRLMRGKKGA